MNPEIIPLLVAGVMDAVLVLVAYESGLVAWARKGCPDYNDAPATEGADYEPVPFSVTQAAVTTVLVDHEDERHPDFQFGFPDRPDRSWPRDTGTKS